MPGIIGWSPESRQTSYVNDPEMTNGSASRLRPNGVGVISGWLPAIQAAKLDPLEALRYERILLFKIESK